ncbi:MAG: hypothetical protein OQJ96_07895 [Flavobacteriales bacterium]|nr:hypothetical protein [Flavobacteriales bacterium]MCW8912257.1 hypothetical protein [Flavobacteriales bacterium]MCW8937504.1 hypothetical protein [Flavobacteriales bacterium]MCW8940141.1 hypothetical protein [Flavobacteriales bacterium]MCW8967171.1 hypothetical protein [Flavobacteriales bacterium]
MVVIDCIETETAILELRDGYLYAAFKEDAIVELEHVIANKEAREKLQQGKKALILGDIRKMWHISKAAQDYLASKEVTNLNIAMAILTSSLMTVLIANFFIKFKKPAAPTKMFKSEEKAIKWLLSFKQ